MKKIYDTPSTMIVAIKNNNLLVQMSRTQAASNAEALSRGDRGSRDSDWDDEEE